MTKQNGKEKFAPLPDGRFQIVYADPPWQYDQSTTALTYSTRGVATSIYDTVPLAILKELPVANIADKDCLLFMWATNPVLPEAMELGKHWGFVWATVGFVWHKTRRPIAGNYTMSNCELCLTFKNKKGKIPVPRGSRNERQLVRAPNTRHSEKPDEVRRRIERMFPTQRKIELFARQRVAGWTSWGNEVGVDAKTPLGELF